ncbi:uncharacterized protein LOC124316223 isoform X3 [Daphnia pulicaria]|uniref:uncharacterized protein LOC124316223 isoform X3 n=1 Tax=Daphnia pulicaria TaxID=35523 RepID=UPI001EECB4B9|nr:uncharacterized protein LOC124316223 isoform X3 [Daphnia pulicaria]
MSIFYVLLSVVLMLQVSRACDKSNEEEQLAAARQQSDEYFANAYGFNSNNPWSSPYYQPSARVPGYLNQYEGRTPLNRQPNYNPFKKYFTSSNVDEENNQPESRFALGGLGANLINTGLFNNRFTPANTWRPFSNLANRIPVSVNPDFSGPLANFDACTSPSGDSGICAPGSVCSLFGGRPSGSCILGKVCCINAITTCGGTVTLNNTYWQSPSTAVSSPSTCALTIRMDTKLVEQLAKPICQIRLDFVSFTIDQPSATTFGTCTDTFQVGGSTSVVPTICGDNTGQHMYLDVPSSGITPSDVQLLFNFAAGTATRSWNIKIALLPCGASYLAPAECLQYFTAATGRVKSFNWKDAAGPRQLNNQNYNICFRTELVSGSRANQMCVSACTTTTAGVAFFLTGPTLGSNIATTGIAPPVAGVVIPGCFYDYLGFPGGQVQAFPFTASDRYCGSALGLSVAGGATVCSKVKPFKMTYGTDGLEPTVPVIVAVPPNPPGVGEVAATAAVPVSYVVDTANTGFCLDYQEK